MTKERILKSAFELFTTHSYSGVTIDDIAKNAKVSKGGVFHYFSSKHELASKCLFHHFEMMDIPLLDEDSTPEEVREFLRSLISHYLDMIKENPKIMRFGLDVYEESIKTGVGVEVWEKFYSDYLENISQLLKLSGVKRPHVKAQLLMITLDAVGLQSIMMSDDNFPWEEFKDEIYSIYIEDQIEEK